MAAAHPDNLIFGKIVGRILWAGPKCHLLQSKFWGLKPRPLCVQLLRKFWAQIGNSFVYSVSSTTILPKTGT